MGQPQPIEPTEEMVAFFEQRTRAHIARVAANLAALAEVTEYGDQLLARAEVHDASKFGPEERTAYIWLTEAHRCRQLGEPFAYPEGVEAAVRAAVRHHFACNRHHPEFHADPNDMTEVDLIEMVCDWTAMSQEFHQDGGSARGWADKTLGNRIHFNPQKTAFIYRIIAELDKQNGVTR